MASALASIREHLRFRLGEISPGTWTDDELDTQINNAEKKVCEDSIILGNALLAEASDTNIIAGQYKYILPSDFISVIDMFQLYSGMQYRLTKSSVGLMLDRFRPATTASRLLKYDVRGIAPAVLNIGVATDGSNTTLVNSDIDFTSMGITTNRDYVLNLTDNSRALITSIGATTLTFSDGLTGGARDSFRLGDEYQIEEAEATRKVLYVYPVPAGSDINTQESYTAGGDSTIPVGDVSGVENKAAQSFQVKTSVVVREVSIYLDTETGSPMGDINIRIETDNSGIPSGTLVNSYASASIKSPTTAWNSATFANVFRLSKNTTYHIVAQTISQSDDTAFNWSIDTAGTYASGQVSTKSGAGAWSNSASSDALFKIEGSTSDESLIIHYARYPREMTVDTDQSEIPQYAREAVYIWAMYLCFSKSPGAGTNESHNMRALYKIEIEEVKDMVRNEEDGHADFVRDVMLKTGIETHKGVSLNIGLPLGVA